MFCLILNIKHTKLKSRVKCLRRTPLPLSGSINEGNLNEDVQVRFILTQLDHVCRILVHFHCVVKSGATR